MIAGANRRLLHRWSTPSSIRIWRRQSVRCQCCHTKRTTRITHSFEAPFRCFSSSIRIDEDQLETKNGNEKSIEDQYSRKTQLEHVLLRPGMYVGPVGRLPPTPYYVLEPLPLSMESRDADRPLLTQSSELRMINKECSLVHALVKIFDEVLVNASDNRLRDPEGCTKIDVEIDPDIPFIKVKNNGKSIPVDMHNVEGMFLPELLFGHLLTGSNFDDDEKRLTGGRHGYGAKLANIFSKEFTVDIVDTERKLRYEQTWRENMSLKDDARIDDLSGKTGDISDSVTVSFIPDIARLNDDPNANSIDMDDFAVMCRRVVDVAGCSDGTLSVTLNGIDVSQPSFEAYVGLYRRANSPKVCFSKLNDRWIVGIGVSEGNDSNHVSFVNGMATTRGGTHVDGILNQAAKHIHKHVLRKNRSLGGELSLAQVRRHLFVACNALVENPSFDSQMKECLTSNPKDFGSPCELSSKFLKTLTIPVDEGGPGIVEEVVRDAKSRHQATLSKLAGSSKSKRQLLGIPKLEDAHKAGSEEGHQCTLILTEGDSAKALAVAGLEVIGRQVHGVFPLRGKFLNVRHARVDQLAKNAELKSLLSILGLKMGKAYKTVEDRQELRYGHVMLMTDQDTDGSHIKGLILNLFRYYWPDLLKPADDDPEGRPFLSSFVTPLLKAFSSNRKEIQVFYSMSEYFNWRSSLTEDELKKWRIKYYKGLGTSTPQEAKEYFAEYDKHHRPFRWESESDGELLDMTFDKTRASARRDWITSMYDPLASIYEGKDSFGGSVSYEDFVNKDLIHFSNADNIRSIPSLMDGLKPSQRKVLYGSFKRKLQSEVKVAQLTGYVAEHTAYHHGEVSLQSTIIGMAQNFVGSNNINLLEPIGQFGTRLEGGRDAASPRYIFTQLSPITRYLFPEEDDDLLEPLEDDGQLIEPRFFLPIIPLLLVNGSQGIGTGWSTNIPSHCPMSVVDYIRAILDDSQEKPRIEPFARGFTGELKREDGGEAYVSIGRARVISSTMVEIDELPLGVWTNTFKRRLLAMQARGDITDFLEEHSASQVSFKVRMKKVKLDEILSLEGGLTGAFKLAKRIPLTNMNAIDENGVICKFGNAEEMADKYFPLRLDLYHERKRVQEADREYAAKVQQNKSKFIQAVMEGEVDLMAGRQSHEELVNDLRNLGLSTSGELEHIRLLRLAREDTEKRSARADAVLADNEEAKLDTNGDDYGYLLKMPFSSLTTERIAQLDAQVKESETAWNDLRDKQAEDLWRADLDRLAAKLSSYY